jgi:hypothetical protein
VAAASGQISIGKPSNWRSPFLVSLTPPHQLLAAAQGTMASRRAWAVICAALGLALVLTGPLWPH